MRLLLSTIVFVLPLSCASILNAEEKFKPIFDGKTLDGWEGNPDLWSVEDGAITGVTTDDAPIKANTFLVWKGTAADFVLRLDFKSSKVGNSGVQYRSKVLDKEKFIVGGYQADIDPSMKFAGINYEEKGRGILATRGQRVALTDGEDPKVEQFGKAEELAKKIKQTEWNSYRIVAKGRKLSHYINGELMSEVIDNSKEKFAEKGVIALQLHRGPAMKIQFKNVKLKELK